MAVAEIEVICIPTRHAIDILGHLLGSIIFDPRDALRILRLPSQDRPPHKINLIAKMFRCNSKFNSCTDIELQSLFEAMEFHCAPPQTSLWIEDDVNDGGVYLLLAGHVGIHSGVTCPETRPPSNAPKPRAMSRRKRQRHNRLANLDTLKQSKIGRELLRHCPGDIFGCDMAHGSSNRRQNSATTLTSCEYAFVSRQTWLERFGQGRSRMKMGNNIAKALSVDGGHRNETQIRELATVLQEIAFPIPLSHEGVVSLAQKIRYRHFDRTKLLCKQGEEALG